MVGRSEGIGAQASKSEMAEIQEPMQGAGNTEFLSATPMVGWQLLSYGLSVGGFLEGGGGASTYSGSVTIGGDGSASLNDGNIQK